MNKTFLAALAIIILGLLGGFYIFTNNKNKSTDNSQTTQTTGQSQPSSTTGATSGANVADYSGKGLTKFPKEVLSKTNTTVLNLSNNNLTGALPAEIHNLTKLEELYVNDNQMTGIPAEVGQLRHLKILNYANNKITGLPMELGKLTQLQVLDLTGNNPSQQDISQIKAKLTNTQIKI